MLGKIEAGGDGTAEDKMVGWHHGLNGYEFGQTLRKSEGQGSLVCYSPWGHKELDKTEWLNNRMYTLTTLEYYSVIKEKEILSFVTIWVDLEVIMLSEVKVTQLCPTLCDPMDYTFHGILQARILEWVAFPFSRGSFQPRIEPRSPALQADSLPAEPQVKPNAKWNKS